ncbi:hypothetical protein HPB52_005728 [Rhipicephalus sanguineus]|uniref:Vitellogenin domain-containing protein n=1 Tax=Rhipicephalus sanguineus TaxID=34632 RepID=A0A9D4PBP2_RHISA|nr:hypothetical protein HPB52_005728 [Rhipicephalus sanguineus]
MMETEDEVIVDFEAEAFHSDNIDVAHHEFDYVRNEDAVSALQRPFAARFNDGKVEEIEIDKNEPTWARNMKKGVLSLFQLDLFKGRQQNPQARKYNVKEDGVHGPCDSLYIVHTEDNGHIEVTKAKNLEKCDREIYATYGRQKGSICVKCESQRTFLVGLRSLARLEYTDEDIRNIDNEINAGQLFHITFHSFSTFDYQEIDDVYRNHVLTAPEDIKDSIR